MRRSFMLGVSLAFLAFASPSFAQVRDISAATPAQIRAQVEALGELPLSGRSSAAAPLAEAILRELEKRQGPAVDRGSLSLSLAMARSYVNKSEFLNIFRGNVDAITARIRQGGGFSFTEVDYNLWVSQYAELALRDLTPQNAPKDWAQANLILAEQGFDRADDKKSDDWRRADAAATQALTIYTRDAFPKEHVDAVCIQESARASKIGGETADMDVSNLLDAFDARAMAIISQCKWRFGSTEGIALTRGILPFVLDKEMSSIFPAEVAFDFFTLARALKVSGALSLADLGLSSGDVRQARALLASIERMERDSPSPALFRARADLLDIIKRSKPSRAEAPRSSTPGVVVIAFDKDRAIFGSRGAAGAAFTPTAGQWTQEVAQASFGSLGVSTSEDGTPPPGRASVSDFFEQLKGRAVKDWVEQARRAQASDNNQGIVSASIEAFRQDFEPRWAPALFEAVRKAGVKPGERVVIYPDSAASMLPIGLLRNPRTGRALSEEYEVVMATSAAVLATAEERARTRTAKSIAVVAPKQAGLDMVPFETAMAARSFGVDAPGPTVGDKASVLAQLNAATYWHFATHGAFDPIAPMSSGVAIKPVRDVGDLKQPENVLSLSDLFGGAVEVSSPRLVVLSACETGIFDTDFDPDEFLGLPSGFIALGAAGVVSSLWQVDDLATALLMGKFYDLHLRENKRPPEALRLAQIWLKGSDKAALLAFISGQASAGSITAAQAGAATSAINVKVAERPFESPYYWGAFTYYGA